MPSMPDGFLLVWSKNDIIAAILFGGKLEF
jgi:hypothetical protein